MRFCQWASVVLCFLFMISNASSVDMKLDEKVVIKEPEKKPELLMGATASMLADSCAGCHGPDGASAGSAIPIIAGLSVDYFVARMHDFKEDAAPATLMTRIAKGYTTSEIKLIAEYFSKREFVAAKGQQSDPELAKKGEKLHQQYCEKCHSGNGTLAVDNVGILAGQWKAYLQASLEDFMFGDRKAPKKMARRLRKLVRKEGAEGIEALVEFYAQ